jgi:hypothetical protein
MKILSVRLALFLLSVIVFADDILIPKAGAGKKEVCKITGLKNNILTYTDSKGQPRTINVYNVAEIKFDIPAEPLTVGKTAVTIEELNTFPEKFVGQKLIFEHCQVDQVPNKGDIENLYHIFITSKGGQRCIYSPGKDHISFQVPQKIAEKMVKDGQGSYYWTDCTISCLIQKTNESYIAVIDQIDIYNRGGKIGTTYKADK